MTGLAWEHVAECPVCGAAGRRLGDALARVWRCEACGLAYRSPRPTEAAIRAFYSRPGRYERWVAGERGRARAWRLRVRRLERLAPDGRLLDVGAGAGELLHHGRGWFRSAVGTEVSLGAAEVARDRHGIELRLGDLRELAFPESSRFDVVALVHVLEHVRNPAALLERCCALLEAGGSLAVAVPNELGSLRARALRARMRARRLLGLGLGGYEKAGIGPLGLRRLDLEGDGELHLVHFAPATLARLLAGAGLEVRQARLDFVGTREGWRSFPHEAYYRLSQAVLALTGANLYDAMWVVAARPVARRGKA